MANPQSSAALVSPSQFSESNRAHLATASTNGNVSPGPVVILWDMENCPIPNDIRPDDVAGNIRMALRVHPVITGPVTMFSAYGDFNFVPRRVREGCQKTGVKLVDVPNGKKDAADKAILVDMFLFALDNPPPSSIVLISGDVDFSPALHILGQRGYTVVLVFSSGKPVSSALCNAGCFVWDWHSVARGEGFLPVCSPRVCQSADLSVFLSGCSLNDKLENDEEGIVYRGSAESRSLSVPSGLNEVASEQYDILWARPGDLNGLKAQLVKLLESLGGCLSFNRLPSEYQRMFKRPLFVEEYGAAKLVSLMKKVTDVLKIDGQGPNRMVYLRNSKPVPVLSPTILSRKDKKGKGISVILRGGSSEESSEEERVVAEETDDQDLVRFKVELQDILVSYSCRVFMGSFEAIYQQRYKRPLDYRRFGVSELEELLDKVKDVAVLLEEDGSRRKFIFAVGG